MDCIYKNIGTAGLPIILKGHSILPTTVTVTVKLQHSDSETTGFTDVAASKDYSVAELAKGTYFPVTTDTKRYLRLVYTVTGTVTGGTISAYIGNDADMRNNYQAVVGAGEPV